MSSSTTPTIRDLLRQQLITEIAPHFRLGVPLAQQRQVLDGMGAAGELPTGLTIQTAPVGGVPADRLRIAGGRTDRILLHLHGGGYVMGSCQSHRALCAWLGRAVGVSVLLPAYRLAPEHPFPAAIEDALAVYRALLQEGFAPHQIALSGDSAGGGLVMATLLSMRDAGLPMPAAAVLLSPWTDFTFSGASIQSRADLDPWLLPELLAPFGALYRGEHDPRDPRLSPVFADLQGLPPMLIQVGDHEILLSDAQRLAERARACGVAATLEVWPDLWHVWHLLAPVLPEANAALEVVGAFLQRALHMNQTPDAQASMGA